MTNAGLIEQATAFERLGPAGMTDVVVIGAGQAGLSTAYHLQKSGVECIVLDSGARIGDVWRGRWESLRLFTPAWLDALDGLAFPGDPQRFPTKDEMADYLESYARHFALDVRLATRVTALTRSGTTYRVETNRGTFLARQVVIAMSSFQKPRIPAFAKGLRSDIVQLHSSQYNQPESLKPGHVLIAGAGNSGAEIAVELAKRGHTVSLAGRDTGSIPFRIDGFWSRLILCRLLLRFFFHHILTIRTPLGRKARPKMLVHGGPLIRQRPEELEKLGIQRTQRVVGERDGIPCLDDGTLVQASNVIWCTGFDRGLDFVQLPIFDSEGAPQHVGGVVTSEPGLCFVGQAFQYSMSSTMIHGVGRDAARMAALIATRLAERPQTGPSTARLMTSTSTR
ncbi:MAG TPA: FAD-dependent oxidoreductase [Polyangiaceae bacterium]|jgi:putative flavoprotein involved in K+ transport|nr:FAD-dependent oxidoreductase [Polyangiaceae bacterium]